jgi:hypothetical protein
MFCALRYAVSMTGADFLVDDVRGFIGDLLVLRDLAAQEHFTVSSNT